MDCILRNCYVYLLDFTSLMTVVLLSTPRCNLLGPLRTVCIPVRCMNSMKTVNQYIKVENKTSFERTLAESKTSQLASPRKSETLD